MDKKIFNALSEIVNIPYKTISFFAKITNTSYEMFFYLDDGTDKMQCYEMAEKGMLDENELDRIFGNIAKEFKAMDDFDAELMSIISFVMDTNKVLEFEVKKYDKSEKVQGLKKQWISEHI